jgi:NAD(P)-dependent dehydrogenase (short-subunit alcohol dehydrogenase family)
MQKSNPKRKIFSDQSSFPPKKVTGFGMVRPGEPVVVEPSYIFLASNDSQYITGKFLHPNGGEIING